MRGRWSCSNAIHSHVAQVGAWMVVVRGVSSAMPEVVAEEAALLPTPTFSVLAAEALSINQDMGHEGWIDDASDAAAALHRHRKSPEYRELHRQGYTTTDMGLFGGEPGFEKTHRVWVDPDRPHMKHVYNSTPLAKNIRYSRYGYYKREMHLLDIDKLVRHARMVPHPERLLTDFLYQKVPLKDKDSAALMRYMGQTLFKLNGASIVSEFPRCTEMFERMLTSNIPPIEVGPLTHGEAIRCCAVAGNWHVGWDQYRARAIEVEEDYLKQEAADADGVSMEGVLQSTRLPFVLGSHYYEALLELCVACHRPIEGLRSFREFLQRGIIPPPHLLASVQLLLSMMPQHSANADNVVDLPDLLLQSNDAWALYELYGVQRDVASIRARMQCGALLGSSEVVLDALHVAEQTGCAIDEQCYAWVLFSLRGLADMGDYVLELLTKAKSKGLCIDYRIVTYALMYFAHQGEGDGALVVYQQYILPQDMNITAEILLLTIQAFCRSPEPTHHMLLCAQDCWARFHRVGSAVDFRKDVLEAFMTLCAQLGAAATAFSLIKEVLSKGHDLTPTMLNAVLKANAIASTPNGSATLSTEVVELFQLLRIEGNIDTAEALLACHDAHGSTERTQRFTNATVERLQQTTDDAIPHDELLDVFAVPPHELRGLKLELRLDVRDMFLMRFGQTVAKPAKRDDKTTVLGRIQPFGPWPGTVDV